MPPMTETTAPASPKSDRSRWLALYVLCASVLMIVIDATIVNVALPSIQDDLGFSQSDLAWVINAYLIPFGGLLLLAGRMGDLIGQRRIFLIGLVIFTAASVLCAVAPEPGHADRRALRAGRRRRAHLGRGARDDRDDVPRAARAGQGHRRLRLRGLGRRLDRPAGRRRAHRGHQLALDLLHQRSRGHRHGACWRSDWSRRTTASGSARAPTIPGAVVLTGRPDARRLHDPAGGRAGLGLHPDARARRDLAGAGGGLRAAPGAHREPAHAAAAVPLAQRVRARTWSWRSSWPACSRCSSSARSTCSGCSATTRSRSGWRSCPRRS